MPNPKTQKKKKSRKKGNTRDDNDDDAPKKGKARAQPKISNKVKKMSEAQAEYERLRAEGFSDDDEFMSGADKISLNRKQDSGSEEENYDRVVSESEDEDEDEEVGENSDEVEENEAKRARADKDIANVSKAWGKKKKDYYGADTSAYEVMGEDEQATINEEEEESKRLQQEAVEELGEEDVDISSMLESMVAAEKTGKVVNQKTLTKLGPKQGDDELLSALRQDLTALRESGQAEKLSKDVSAMTTSEKKEVLKLENPELLPLLEEVSPILNELQNQLHPLILKVREQKLPTSDGLSFLELKYQLLLTYCTNLCFYLMLKAEGKSVKKHPVIKQLASLRVIMEKMRSIDAKLKYQVEKLLKTASLGPDHETSAQDPLSYRPNASALVPKVDKDADTVYQAPKMTAVQFDEDEKRAEKRRTKQEKARAKAEKSGLIQHLRGEIFADRPEEIKGTGGIKKPSFIAEREEFEEDQFVRLTETKADKRKIKAAKRAVNEDLDFDDFGDLHAFSTEDESKYASKYDRIAEKKNKKFANDDTPWSMPQEDIEEGQAMYEENKKKSKKKKEEQKAAHPNRVYAYGEMDPDLAEEGARREAGKKIVKNRGLTRLRPKLTHNPRAAKRKKFDTAIKKRKSTVREFAGQQPHYGGEASGVKTDIIKSTKIK